MRVTPQELEQWEGRSCTTTDVSRLIAEVKVLREGLEIIRGLCREHDPRPYNAIRVIAESALGGSE